VRMYQARWIERSGRSARAPGRLEAYCRSMDGVGDALLAAASRDRSGRDGPARPGPAADLEADVAIMAQDLALLLREHIRKEDGVINPRLERLLWEGVRS